MKMIHKKKGIFPIVALSVSVIGFVWFYLFPFVYAGFYAFVDNPVRKRFVGLQNFVEIFQNEFFLRGLSNMVRFMAIAIPLSMLASLVLALALKRLSLTGNFLSVMFLIPLVIPSASVVQFWMKLPIQQDAFATIVLIYIWKYMGYNAVLFLAGLHGIKEEYYQCAKVLGANGRQCFYRVTLVYLIPSFFLVFIMSFVNSFKIYREVYLMWNDYPPQNAYLLQHFVNNTLLSMRYEKLVSAVYVLTAGIVPIVAFFFRKEKEMGELLHE